jgi:protein arginine kinase
MTIGSLIEAPSEFTDSSSGKSAIVLMTRIRLARNLAGHPFPGWAKPSEREKVLESCRSVLISTPLLKRGLSVGVDELGELERRILVERHLISRELSG